MALFQKRSAVLELAVKKTEPPPHPFAGEESALVGEAGALFRAEGERLRLSAALAEAERAVAAERDRLEFLSTAAGMAQSSDQDMRAAAAKVVQLERLRSQAEAALADFDQSNGNLHQRGIALSERQKALDRKILEWEWKQNWLALLPKAEEVFIEMARLQSLAWRQELRIPGFMAAVAGLPVEARPDGKETSPEDIRRVLAFQRALFAGEVPPLAQTSAIPSSLRVSWWRGF